MGFYNLELKKLQKFEKELNKVEELNIYDAQDFVKVWETYKKLLKFGEDFSGKAYYKLYKKYGNKNINPYEDRLKIYTYHSQEISWRILQNKLKETDFNKLLQYFQKLQNRLKVFLINYLGEEEYKKFYLQFEYILLNTRI